jgi:hypothetical protein
VCSPLLLPDRSDRSVYQSDRCSRRVSMQTGLTGWAEAAHSCSCRSFFLWNLVISAVKFVNHIIYVHYVSYCVFELGL